MIGALIMLDGLRSNSTLRSLDLAENRIGDETLQRIAEVLRRDEVWIWVDLDCGWVAGQLDDSWCAHC